LEIFLGKTRAPWGHRVYVGHVGVIKTPGSLYACVSPFARLIYAYEWIRRAWDFSGHPRRWLFPDFAAWESRRCILDRPNSRARWFSVRSLRCNSLFSLFPPSSPCTAVYHRLVPMITSIDYSLFARWRGALWLLRVLLYLETSCDLRQRIGSCRGFVSVWRIAGIFNIHCERVRCLFYTQWLLIDCRNFKIHNRINNIRRYI